MSGNDPLPQQSVSVADEFRKGLEAQSSSMHEFKDEPQPVAATERELAMLADLKACAEVIGEETVFGVTLSRNIAAYERELGVEDAAK